MSLCNIHDVSVDNGGTVYFTNQGCWHFLRITPAGLLYDEAGAASASFTGDCGPADSADIQSPYGIYPDNLGNVYLCPRGNIRVRKVNTLNYIKTVVGTGVAGYTGDGGLALSATVSSTLYGVYADSLANIYFADVGNNVIRWFTSTNYTDTVSVPLCAGGTDTLTVPLGSGSGTWSSSNTAVAIIGSTSGILTGEGAGVSIITYNNLGCPALYYISVVVPTIASTVGGASAMCIGATLGLTDSVAGGVWTSASPGVASVGSLTGVVTGISAGTATITHTTGTCFAIGVVTVNVTPAPITGSVPFCAGSFILLGETVGGGVWSSSNIIVATAGTDGTVTGNIAGTATITYTIGSCYVTQAVTVDTQPVAIGGNMPVCQTFSITLTDATAGGIWSSVTPTVAAISAGGVVAGINTGTDTISYTLGICAISAVVTVNTQPAAISGALNVCQGFTTLLSDATTGGTWSSTNTSVAGIGTDGTVTGGATGTSTISYTLGMCAATAVVTVNTQPSLIASNTPVCQTFSITLTDITTGGTWTSATPTVASITAGGVVTGINVGTSVVTYTLGSCFTTDIVTVNLQPAGISGVLSVCQGFTTLLSDATTGGTWISTNTSVAGISAGGTVTGGATGTATISYTVGSCAATAIVTVNTQPGPISGNTPVCQTYSITLTDATTGGTWVSSTPAVASVSAGGTVTGAGIGTATITYTLGSCFTTTIVTVNTQPVSISGVPSVCMGFTTSLTDATGGGTWSSSNGSIAGVSGTGIVTGNGVGTATITYAVGSCYVTQNVTVNTQPGPIGGNAPVCQTFSVTLTDGTASGVWSSATPTVAAITAGGVVTGAAAGTAIISYALGSCYVTTVVTVNTQPVAISGTPSVCQGFTTILTDATGGGTWGSSNTTIAGVNSTGTVTGNSAGTATITYALGSCYVMQDVTVNTQPGPIGGNTHICQTFSTLLVDGTAGGTWSSTVTGVAAISTGGLVTGGTVGTSVISYIIGGCYVTTIVTVDTQPAAISGTLAVCLGLTTTLTDATGGGVWSSTATTIASITPGGVVTGNATGNAIVSYTLGICAATAIITVEPLPAPITGPAMVCRFDSVALHDVTVPGTWSSSNTALAAIGLTSGVVTGVAAGTVTISYILGTGCGVSYNMTVNPAPSPIITPLGDTIVCPGGFVALTANVGAGLSYHWYVGGSAISGALSSSYIATSTGSYQVQETDALGCSAMSIPMLATIAAPAAVITAAGSTSVCSGTGASLNANTGVGLTYQWLKDGTAIAGATSSSYTATVTGNYYVIVTNAAGCSAVSNVIAVSASPSPMANTVLSGAATFCQGGSVLITTAFVAGYTYQWYNSAGAISGATNPSYTAAATEGYYVIVTNTYGCSTTSITTNVTANALPNVGITAGSSTLFCVGGSVTLAALSVPGDTYQWYLDGSVIAGATNATYSATAGGGYEVQVTDPATGCTAETAADTTVTVVTAPSILPLTPTTFCWGSSALLSTNVTGATGAVLYQWYFNGAVIAGATSGVYNVTVPGDYTCQINIPGSCTATTTATPVAEFPLPYPIITFDGVYFHTANYYVSYQWVLDMIPITGATTSSTPALANGDYKVQVTDTNGCQSFSDIYVYTGGPVSLGTGNVKTQEVSVYPNPVTDELTILTGSSSYAFYTITNTLGQETAKGEITNPLTTVNTHSLPGGIYYVTLMADHNPDSPRQVIRLVKL